MVILRPVIVNLIITLCGMAHAGEIFTNNVRFASPPSWLKVRDVEKATGAVQNFLQWDIVRIGCFYHTNEAEFEALHHSGPTVMAFFRRSDSTLHLGPGVNEKNFGPIFSHELVHAVFFQKYKGAIPAWLEEGLANYLGKSDGVNYQWLASQPFRDVTTLTHPLGEISDIRFRYQTSTAVTEMIAAKCDLSDLLALSVGRKLETYLATSCEIQDINATFRKWVAEKSKGGKESPPSKPGRWWEERKNSPIVKKPKASNNP